MSNETFTGIGVAAKAFMTTATAANRVTAQRVELVGRVCRANGVGTKGGASQNKVLEALSLAISQLADGSVSGFGVANLANYAIVSRAIDKRSAEWGGKFAPTLPGLLYSALNTDRNGFDDLVSSGAGANESTFTALVQAAIDNSAAAKKASREAAAAERKAESETAKAKLAEGILGDESDESVVTVESILTAGLSASDVAASIAGFAALPWSPEDAKTIVAALGSAWEKLADVAEMTSAQAALAGTDK